MLDLYTEFEAVIDVLEQHQINYAVCGGLAVSFFAQPRLTQDIDILLAPAECDRCKEILLPLGFQFLSTPMRFDNEAVEVHKLAKFETGGTDYVFLDLVAGISPPVQQILAERIRLSWKGKLVWVVRRDGLIKLKETAKRPKDLLDLDTLREGDEK
jgi:hypothetical protein